MTSDIAVDTPDAEIRSRPMADVRLSWRTFGVGLAAIEVLLIVAVGALAQPVYTAVSGVPTGDPARGVGLGLVAAGFYLASARASGLYRLPAMSDPLAAARRLLIVASGVFCALTAVFFCLKAGAEFSRGALVLFGIGLGAGCGVLRLGAAMILGGLLARGAVAGPPAFLLADRSEASGLNHAYLLRTYGVEEVGRLVVDPVAGFEAALACVPRLAREAGARSVLVTAGWHDASVIGTIEAALRLSPLPVRLIPMRRLRDCIDRTSLAVDPARFLVTLQRSPMSPGDHLLKRSMDLALATAALAVLGPVMLATALAVRLDSPGPALFRQRRTGFDGRHFTILKFRTMHRLDAQPGVLQASRSDPRVTRVGRLLRRSSIDELPQLLNVLRGEMSLVGPRPHAIVHDAHYQTLIERYAFRHRVRPGMTGWAQVSGQRGETAKLAQMARRVELDLWYIANWSPLLDLLILARTAYAVLRFDAY